jgi:hypothetical protein
MPRFVWLTAIRRELWSIQRVAFEQTRTRSQVSLPPGVLLDALVGQRGTFTASDTGLFERSRAERAA